MNIYARVGSLAVIFSCRLKAEFEEGKGDFAVQGKWMVPAVRRTEPPTASASYLQPPHALSGPLRGERRPRAVEPDGTAADTPPADVRGDGGWERRHPANPSLAPRRKPPSAPTPPPLPPPHLPAHPRRRGETRKPASSKCAVCQHRTCPHPKSLAQLRRRAQGQTRSAAAPRVAHSTAQPWCASAGSISQHRRRRRARRGGAEGRQPTRQQTRAVSAGASLLSACAGQFSSFLGF